MYQRNVLPTWAPYFFSLWNGIWSRTTPPKFVTADSWWWKCPKPIRHFLPLRPLGLPCLLLHPPPACSSAFPQFSEQPWTLPMIFFLYKLPGVCIFCLNQRTLDVTVNISLCPRKRVRAAISQFQRVSPATTPALLPKRWDSKEQGRRNGLGWVADMQILVCLQKGCHLVDVGQGWLPSLGHCCKPGRGGVNPWEFKIGLI